VTLPVPGVLLALTVSIPLTVAGGRSEVLHTVYTRSPRCLHADASC